MLSARQVLFTGPRAVTLADVTLHDPEPGQLLVRTRFSGISAGTELLAYRGRLDASGRAPGPATRRELFDAMQEVALTGRTTAPQHASVGCSIKWRQG